MNNIVLVGDDKSVLDTIKSNLMLLREFDSLVMCDFLSAENFIAQNTPRLVILYSPTADERTLDFIKRTDFLPVFFISKEFSDDDIINVFEAGAADYISTTNSPTEFLVRVVSCLKRESSLIQNKRNSEILTQIGIIKKGTDLYSVKYTPAVFKSLIKKYTYNNIPTALIAISQDIEDKIKCSLDFLANIMKQNLREDDVIGFGKDKLYILLPNTNAQGALNVYNKIKDILKESCSVSAGILTFGKETDLSTVFKIADEALSDALLLKNTAVLQEETSSKPEMNWLDKPKKHKNFKLFKKAFTKKLETVIAPVFYQKQQIAEQRLFQVTVEQYCDEKKSVFSINRDDIKRELQITYPGTVKINIDINSDIKNEKTTKHSSFDLNELTTQKLSAILDEFILDFQKYDTL